MSKLSTIVGHTVTDDELKEYIDCDVSLLYEGTRSAAEYVIKK